MNLFDLAESSERKDVGMELAAVAKQAVLETARRVAISLAMCKADKTTDSDEVGRYLASLDLPPLGPAAGSIFKDKRWRFTGKRILSTRVTNHRREIKVWELVEDDQ